MAAGPRTSIVQVASRRKPAFNNSSVSSREKRSANGAREARAMLGDHHRNPKETTQRGSRAPAPTGVEMFFRRPCFEGAMRRRAPMVAVAVQIPPFLAPGACERADTSP